MVSGRDDDNALAGARKRVRAVHVPSVSGIDPVMLFVEIPKSSMLLHEPIVLGNEPDRSFSQTWKTSRLVQAPKECEMVPVKAFW